MKSHLGTAALVLALASPAAAASSSPAPADVPQTQMALQCVLGFGDTKCAKNDCHGEDGPVERVDYLGINAAGSGLYAVRFQHRNVAYVVSRDPDEIMDNFGVRMADLYLTKRTIASRGLPKRIYTRSENEAILSPCGSQLSAETGLQSPP
jgi:hypothetical protein